MNKLEKEIFKESTHYRGYQGSFNQGANFIRLKNLPILFAKWLDNVEPNLLDKFIDNGFLDYEKVYEYWENNEYNKEIKKEKDPILDFSKFLMFYFESFSATQVYCHTSLKTVFEKNKTYTFEEVKEYWSKNFV